MFQSGNRVQLSEPSSALNCIHGIFQISFRRGVNNDCEDSLEIDFAK